MSRRLVGLGILAALPTAATGASDWSDLIGKDRRLGSIHPVANSTALAAQAMGRGLSAGAATAVAAWRSRL